MAGSLLHLLVSRELEISREDAVDQREVSLKHADRLKYNLECCL